MTLVRPVGLGLASRGDVRDAVGFAERARAAGCESVWFHESYFERDAVTYATAVAASVPDLGVALGALSTYARPTALTAMTVSALDDLAPGPDHRRARLGAAAAAGPDGHPVRRRAWRSRRCAPSCDDAAGAVVGRAAAVRTGAAADRADVPAGAPGAALRRRLPDALPRAGRAKARRLPGPAGRVDPLVPDAMVRIAAAAAGGRARPGRDRRSAGYLLALVDYTRRAALNRAKREPFVIYMMAIQSDVALRRAGLRPRAQATGSSRPGGTSDYHGAAELIPDELMDAFILCGTPRRGRRRADGVRRGRDAAAGPAAGAPGRRTRSEYVLRPPAVRSARRPGPVPPAVGARRRPAAHVAPRSPRPEVDRAAPAAPAPGRDHPAVQLHRLDRAGRGGRRRWPLLDGLFTWAPVPGWRCSPRVLLHVGTNVINEVYDVRKGIDSITSPRASHALVKGRVTETRGVRPGRRGVRAWPRSSASG